MCAGSQSTSTLDQVIKDTFVTIHKLQYPVWLEELQYPVWLEELQYPVWLEDLQFQLEKLQRRLSG